MYLKQLVKIGRWKNYARSVVSKSVSHGGRKNKTERFFAALMFSFGNSHLSDQVRR
jgi:hypothetical protein